MSETMATKTVEQAIEIEASPDEVWQAISTAEELQRWFPLTAEIVPGVGGTVTIAWGPDVAGTGRIDVWEEGRRLRYIERPPVPDETVQVTVDYTIEARLGRTVLRMVQSGFSAADDRAHYLDTIDSGWRYFLSNLKHYLERHAGTPRRMVWDRRKIGLAKAEAWDVLFGDNGLAATELPPTPGAAATLWSGDAGEVDLISHPIHLSCRCPGINDALLFVELEPGSGAFSLGVWLSLYGVPEPRAAELEASLNAKLDALFEPVEIERVKYQARNA